MVVAIIPAPHAITVATELISVKKYQPAASQQSPTRRYGHSVTCQLNYLSSTGWPRFRAIGSMSGMSLVERGSVLSMRGSYDDTHRLQLTLPDGRWPCMSHAQENA